MKHYSYNFFLTNQGVCLKSFLIKRSTTHLYLKSFFKQYKRALFDFVISKYARSGKYEVLDKSKIYLIVNHPWFNYYHWILESLPRIIRYKEELKELTLILPHEIYKHSFVCDSLKGFDFDDMYIHSSNSHFKVPQGVISPIQPYCSRYDKKTILDTSKYFKELFHADVANKADLRKIYVTRKNSPRRKFVNEQMVIQLMENNGIEVIDLENATLQEQVILFSNTALLISIHGAALTNMLFMPEKTKVVELYRKRTSFFNHKSKVYKNLAPILNIEFQQIACEAENKNDSFFIGNLIANISELEKQL